MIDDLSKSLYNLFVINKRYFAIQKNNKYYAISKYINSNTILNILKNKNSFLCYQEDYNFLKWICFDFDINTEIKDEFEKNKDKYYNELIVEVCKLKAFLISVDIDFLCEFSGNRGIHIWIIFENKISRQDGFIIFQTILNRSKLNLDVNKFSLDKYPKSLISVTKTDKGTGVKLPLSFHQKSKKYSILLTKEQLEKFNIHDFEFETLSDEIISSQLKILNEYKKQKKENLFTKLKISEKTIDEEIKKKKYLKSNSIFFKEDTVVDIINSLKKCSHLNKILLKKSPSEKERKIIVGLMGQLKKDQMNIGQSLLHNLFMTMDGADENIINRKIFNCNRYLPPTCEYFRSEFNDNCLCKDILETPLEFLTDFKYEIDEVFNLKENIFNDIVKSQINYSKQNDEILLYHTLSNLRNLEYDFIKEDIENLKKSKYKFDNVFKFRREEKDKVRKLYSISSRDKVVTTFAIKILDSLLYKDFSSHSFGYKFNNLFYKYNIFENWLNQWNRYIKELKTLIYEEDFRNYYILKLDIKSFYDNINLQKLQIELNYQVEISEKNKIIDSRQREFYLNIINELIQFSKKILEKDNGLPQGPAFARYLAEFYLTSLDQLIEFLIGEEGFYFRYVDDMFIILPSFSEINLVEEEIKKHLITKKLDLNDQKFYKGRISEFYGEFNIYLNDEKYFINIVDKNQNIYSSKKVYETARELINLIEDKDKNINDKNLTFLFTHLENNKDINEKKEQLETYIIEESKVRGSFLGIFWKYYFDKYCIEELNLLLLENLEGLKRETFLNSLLIKIRGNNDLGNCSTLKSLFSKYLEKEPSKVEKLLLLGLYSELPSCFDRKIIEYLRNEMTLLDTFITSSSTKKLTPEIIEVYENSIKREDFDQKMDYLHNLFFRTENVNLDIVIKFSSIFIDIIITRLENNSPDTKIDYLSRKDNIFKYIDLLYISTLFHKTDASKFQAIYPVWQNLLLNLNCCEILKPEELSKRAFWKEKINKFNLKDSNINILMPMINKTNYDLTKGCSDKLHIVDNYFNCLIEVIYLFQGEKIEIEGNLNEIKQVLIKDMKMEYLGWVDNSLNFYPSKNLCIRNSIFNNITILRKDNRILIRVENNLEFKEEIKYLKIEESFQELAFDGKYKNIIYSFDYANFKEIDLGRDVYDKISELLLLKDKLQQFTDKFYSNPTYINFFYSSFFYEKESKRPLLPHDGFSKYFLMEDDNYNLKNQKNYYGNIIELLKKEPTKFVENDKFEIFKGFDNSFFPRLLSDNFEKIVFLEKFNELCKLKPNNIFSLDDYLVDTIYFYLLEKDELNIYNFFSFYTSLQREDRESLLFDYNFDLEINTLKNFFNMMKKSLNHNRYLMELLSDEIKKIETYGLNLENFKKGSLAYDIEDDEYFIRINTVEVLISSLKYTDISLDELTLFEFNTSDLKTYKNSEFVYIFHNGSTYLLIKLPEIFEKVYSLLKTRNRAFSKGEYAELFRPKISIDEISHYEYFEEAVNVLNKHYKYSKQFDSPDKVKLHLVNWLRAFDNQDDITTFLCIISKHKFFEDLKVDSFLKKLNDYNTDGSYIISNIKDPKDNNGLYRLIQSDVDGNLLRELEPNGFNDFPKEVLESKKKKIVFVVDIILSGTQIKKAFEKCYFKDIYSKKDFEVGKYHLVDEKDFDVFKNILKNFDEIVFHSIYYTYDGEKKISDYFKKLNSGIKVSFTGEVKNLDDFKFKSIVENIEKDKFVKFIQNKKFLNNNFIIDDDYIKKSEQFESSSKLDERNIFVRYNSTPFKRFYIFTAQPKKYHMPLFDYKKESKNTK